MIVEAGCFRGDLMYWSRLDVLGCSYRVSHKTVFTLFLLICQVSDHLMDNLGSFSDSIFSVDAKNGLNCFPK